MFVILIQVSQLISEAQQLALRILELDHQDPFAEEQWDQAQQEVDQLEERSEQTALEEEADSRRAWKEWARNAVGGHGRAAHAWINGPAPWAPFRTKAGDVDPESQLQ